MWGDKVQLEGEMAPNLIWVRVEMLSDAGARGSLRLLENTDHVVTLFAERTRDRNCA
jgi:hypothetical protein